MLNVEVIGNLGADAREESVNGSKFLSFNVAHKDSWTGQDGVKHEKTVWVSCALNGDGGGLRQYLVKGKTVFVRGRLSTRVFSSQKERKMVAGLNCAVDRIELIGGRVDEVPSRLSTNDGYLVDVNKAYYVSQDHAKAAGATETQSGILLTPQGRRFEVNVHGFVKPCDEEVPENKPQDSNTDVEVF